MRTIKELLILLRDRIEEDIDPRCPTEMSDASGMCNAIILMKSHSIIIAYEKSLLDKYLFDNKPVDADFGWWWESYLREPRLKWLNEQIDKL